MKETRGARSIPKALTVGMLVGVVAALFVYFIDNRRLGRHLGVALFVGAAMAVTAGWAFYRRGWAYFTKNE